MAKASESTTGRRDAWSRYWASGATHSLEANTFGELLGPATTGFWRGVFSRQAPGTRLLEIGCGNGALLKLAIDYLEPKGPLAALCAIDLASVQLPWLSIVDPQIRRSIDIREHCAVEAMPWPDQSFDLIVSQYALEYSNLVQSLPECNRVLVDSGRIALVIHHVESRPVSLASLELGHIAALLAEDGLIGHARQLAPLLAVSRSPQGRERLTSSPEANRIRDGFNVAQSAISGRASAKSEGADVLHIAQDVVATAVQESLQGDVLAALRRLDDFVVALQDSRLRLEELCNCAMSARSLATMLQELSGRITPLGSRKIDTLLEEGFVLGWTVTTD